MNFQLATECEGKTTEISTQITGNKEKTLIADLYLRAIWCRLLFVSQNYFRFMELTTVRGSNGITCILDSPDNLEMWIFSSVECTVCRVAMVPWCDNGMN